MKTMRFRLLSLSVVSILTAGFPAHAQVCDTLFEVISTIKPPTYGFPTVWDADYGTKDMMVQFSGGLLMG